ncbi:Uncharacterised protein [Candidatus Gugararchaeum adminiculabundum]|nr:Uncharacterised protein [Candidatus Gugararchaeum adminiculabundum]
MAITYIGRAPPPKTHYIEKYASPKVTLKEVSYFRECIPPRRQRTPERETYFMVFRSGNAGKNNSGIPKQSRRLLDFDVPALVPPNWRKLKFGDRILNHKQTQEFEKEANAAVIRPEPKKSALAAVIGNPAIQKVFSAAMALVFTIAVNSANLTHRQSDEMVAPPSTAQPYQK